MSRRSFRTNAQAALILVVAMIGVLIVGAVVNWWEELRTEGPLPCVVGAAIVVAIAVAIYLNNRKVKAKRLAAAEAVRATWGDDICDWLIQERKWPSDATVTRIMSRLAEWGQGTCLLLLRKQIGLGMSADMVRASLGEPDALDNEDITKSGRKYRWIYGVPRHGAAYIWFKNDEVVRIKQ